MKFMSAAFLSFSTLFLCTLLVISYCAAAPHTRNASTASFNIILLMGANANDTVSDKRNVHGRNAERVILPLLILGFLVCFVAKHWQHRARWIWPEAPLHQRVTSFFTELRLRFGLPRWQELQSLWLARPPGAQQPPPGSATTDAEVPAGANRPSLAPSESPTLVNVRSPYSRPLQ